MNPNKPDLHELLDALLPPAGAPLGPTRAQVLGMLHRRRARRYRFRAVIGTVALFAVAAGGLFWQHGRDTTPRVVRTAEPTPAKSAIVVKEIDDDQLYALLGDTPVAVMEWPNGDRTLIVVEK